MSDREQSALEAYNEGLLHATQCLKAIESIGGDPAAVGELVAALRAIDGALRTPSRNWPIAMADAVLAARAVLAKLPQEKKDD